MPYFRLSVFRWYNEIIATHSEDCKHPGACRAVTKNHVDCSDVRTHFQARVRQPGQAQTAEKWLAEK
jgi:hypothetical protein